MERGLLAVIGPDIPGAQVAAEASRHGLVAATALPGLSLYAGRRLPVQRPAAGKLMVGEMFGAPATESGSWGNYLVFSTEHANRVTAERAPLTGLPLYWTRHRGAVLCFSHLELVCDLGLGLALDPDFLRQSLAYRNLRTARTGLAGVAELLPGTRLVFANRVVAVDPTWSPWDFAAPDRTPDAAAAALAVERCTIACIDSWAASRGEILLELSGGLDSSIVAACLAACGRSFTGVTVATASADGDERRFARDVADRCGVRLLEVPHEDSAIDLTRPPAILSPRPAASSILAGFDRAIDRTARAAGRGAFFSGIGGDNIFCYSHSIAPALDAWRRFGPGRTVLRTLGDIARVTDTTVWHAARVLWRRLHRRVPAPIWDRDMAFAAADALPDAAEVHPWALGAGAFPAGKQQHVEALIRIADFLDRPARWHDQDVVTPLLSQPLVELCLAVPSWMWIAGGRDRAVARDAFAARLPASVVTRRTKGRLETMCAEAFQRDRAKLAPLLLEGRLANMGLLDRMAIETFLARGAIDADFAYFRLMEIADLELWVGAVEARLT